MKQVKIPWAAWRPPKFLELGFSDNWQVKVCRMKGWKSTLKEEKIKEHIKNPLGTENLSNLAKDKEKIVIVVDDMTRTTPVSKILPYVIKELYSVNIKDDQITILLALGAHKPMSREDCIKKLGKDITDGFNIENHHPYENLIDLGKSKLGTPIHINKTYYESDLKISIGGVIPHPLAGFGGGAKIVLPGISGIETLEANHSAAMRGIGAGIGRMTKVRKDIEDIAEKVGLDFSINVILNEIGDIAALNAGHFKVAHRRAMEMGKKYYKTEVPLENDIAFFNLYPEDSELNQAIKGFNFLMTAPKKMLKRNGTIVLLSSSYEGRGYHSLIAETGARLYTNLGDNIIWKAFVKKRNVCFYSPNLNSYDLHHFFPKSVKLFRNIDPLLSELEKLHGPQPKAMVVPSSIQLP